MLIHAAVENILSYHFKENFLVRVEEEDNQVVISVADQIGEYLFSHSFDRKTPYLRCMEQLIHNIETLIN